MRPASVEARDEGRVFTFTATTHQIRIDLTIDGIVALVAGILIFVRARAPQVIVGDIRRSHTRVQLPCLKARTDRARPAAAIKQVSSDLRWQARLL